MIRGMYVPAHFAIPDDEALALLARCDFGELVTCGPDGLEATPLPWVYDPTVGERGALVAHVARNTTQWRLDGAEAMVILRGPDHYVSPGWLPSKEAGAHVVPTWDYLAVHAYGRLVAHDDPAWVRDALDRLTDRHEAHQPSPWRVTDADPGRVTGQVRALVGIEVQITRWVAKAKMSQNKTPDDVRSEITHLQSLGQSAAADYKTQVSLPAATRRAQTLADVARSRRAGD